MAMDATIRLARMDDLPALLELYRLLDAAIEAPLSWEQAQDKFREILSSAHHQDMWRSLKTPWWERSP